MRWTLVIAACLMPQMASAHAFLDHASPAAGSQFATPPPSVDLSYSEPVEPAFSTVQVTDADGTPQEVGKPTVRDGGRLLSIVALKPLPPGVYTVEWHVTSVDTHKTQGHFTFTIKP